MARYGQSVWTIMPALEGSSSPPVHRVWTLMPALEGSSSPVHLVRASCVWLMHHKEGGSPVTNDHSYSARCVHRGTHSAHHTTSGEHIGCHLCLICEGCSVLCHHNCKAEISKIHRFCSILTVFSEKKMVTNLDNF